jgi:hypothetical protein
MDKSSRIYDARCHSQLMVLVGTITRKERLAFTGDVAEQIQDLPDGSQIKFDWVE